ncbi:UDP-N-acetylglucosamine transporter isoform X2 [Parasteatoda tepidariorum]|nr:UDP-N-acetylglucosamine transporter isoform X2 [Parasteatoda tepidariorum]
MESSIKSKDLDSVIVSIDLPLAEKFYMRTQQSLKYVSLVTLTVQNAALNIMMRISRTQPELFLSSTAVVISEIIKLFCSLLMVWVTDGESNFKLFLSSLKKEIIHQPMEIVKVAIPSFVYLLQNNLIYVGATHLDAATCQVTYQLKILTTALFSVAMLNRKLNPYQWISLFTLFVGIALVQVAQFDTHSPAQAGQSPLIGFVAIVIACCMSGFAGVYFEKILKGSNVTVWMRNVQLCISSVPLGFGTIFFMNWSDVSSKGFFYGYNKIVWTVILLQAVGGLIVAIVVKFADNILKGFSTSLAIVLSCILSVYIFEFQLTTKFVLGSSLVIGSIFLYGKPYQANTKK